MSIKRDHLAFMQRVYDAGHGVGTMGDLIEHVHCSHCNNRIPKRDAINRRTNIGNNYFCCVQHYNNWLKEGHR